MADGVADGDIADGVEDGDITVAIGRESKDCSLPPCGGESFLFIQNLGAKRRFTTQTIEGAICASKLPKENCRRGSPVLATMRVEKT